MTLGGWAFEKGKRGPNESKVTLFTIGTAFLASGLNVTINERNLMFEKKNIKKYESGGPFKRVKTCPNGPKVIFLLITYNTFWNICARSGSPQLGVVLVLYIFDFLFSLLNKLIFIVSHFVTVHIVFLFL